VANTGQQGFGFLRGAAPSEAVRQPVGDDRFLDDAAYHLMVGDRRLDQYLRESRMGWVVELRSLVQGLDYSALTVRYSEQGRRAFHPRTVLGLVLYGILVRQGTLRELEALSVRDVGAWWMCGGQRVDHSTIGKFIQLHEQELSEEFFQELVRTVSRRLRLRAGVCAIDGTVIEAAASHWKVLRAEAARAAADQAAAVAQQEADNERLQRQAAQAAAAAEAAEQRCEQRAKVGKKTDTVVVAASDPQAVVQPRKDGPMRPGYKASMMVHEAGLIVGVHVGGSNEPAAVGPLLEGHRAVVGEDPRCVLMDAGYHSGALLREMAERAVDVLCPSGKALGEQDWARKGHQGRFAKSQFRYEQSEDHYLCPTGQCLKLHAIDKDGAGREYRRYRGSACGQCTLRVQCTTGKHRTIKRYRDEEYKEAMHWVLEQPAARRCYRRRMEIAERPFGHLKERLGLRRFRRWGLRAVRAEFALYCIALNLRLALNRGTAAVIVILCHTSGGAYGVLVGLWPLLNRSERHRT